ncbi:MAG: thymidine kinase [Bacilli bacterium]|nr:thymidine kinase [Bacilli bacterium]
MSKLYFRYGAMNCGKSTLLMQVAHNYEENNKKVIVIKSSIDTKGEDHLESRIGIKRKVDILINKKESFKKYLNDFKLAACILVDEAQFLTAKQVEELWKVTKQLNIPVICYGLKTDFQSHLFEGSKRLLELADEIEELITICSCGKRAKFNARYVNGKFTLEGKEVVIDGSCDNVVYHPMCGKCYLNELEKNI